MTTANNEPFFDPTTGLWNMGTDNSDVRFSVETSLNAAATEAAGGQPKYDDVECLEIVIPGDMRNRPKRPVSAGDRLKYAAQYNAWKRNQSVRVEGMPVEELPGIAGSQARELRFREVPTVEHLARLPDDMAGALNVVALRDRARTYLHRTQEAAAMKKLTDEKEEATRRLREQDERLERLERLLSAPRSSEESESAERRAQEAEKRAADLEARMAQLQESLDTAQATAAKPPESSEEQRRLNLESGAKAEEKSQGKGNTKKG